MFLSNLNVYLGFHDEDHDCHIKLVKASELGQLHVITISTQAGGVHGGMLLSLSVLILPI